MTLREEILAGESAELEFKEARPKDALKYVKTAVALANGRGGRLIFGVEHVREHVCEQVERLVSVCKGEMTEKELREAVGVRNRPNFTVRYLSRALEGGFLERTVVGARAPTQKYRLTSKGAELAVKSVKKGFC